MKKILSLCLYSSKCSFAQWCSQIYPLQVIRGHEIPALETLLRIKLIDINWILNCLFLDIIVICGNINKIQ